MIWLKDFEYPLYATHWSLEMRGIQVKTTKVNILAFVKSVF